MALPSGGRGDLDTLPRDGCRRKQRGLLALEAEIVICGRRAGLLEETAAELTGRHGGSVDTCAVGLRDAAAVDAMVGRIGRGAAVAQRNRLPPFWAELGGAADEQRRSAFA